MEQRVEHRKENFCLSVFVLQILRCFFGTPHRIYFNVMFLVFFHPILKDGLLNFGCVWLKASNVCAASR